MIKHLVLILFFIAVCTVGRVNAGVVTDLYQADVAASSGEQWQQQALLQVLSRVSGKADVANYGEIDSELKKASSYIKQFEAVRGNDGPRMRVVLDATKVNQLLQQNQLAVWGALRPDILVWQVEQVDGGRNFIRRAEHEFNQELTKAFKHAALPLLLPLYDMDDLMQLSETDVWAGFWQQINQASGRYNADVVLAVTIDQVQQDNKTLYRLTWQRQDDGRTLRNDVQAEAAADLMQQFATELSAQLAARYASVLTTDNNASMQLAVTALTSLSDVVQVQQLLQQVVGVSDVIIARYEAGVAQFTLRSSSAEIAVLNALRFNPRLRQQISDTVAVDSTQAPVLATFEYIKR